MNFSYPADNVYESDVLTVFSDAADGGLYHYQIMKPRIVMENDSPVFSLIMFRSGDGLNGGYLTMDIELPPEKNELQKAERYILKTTGKASVEMKPLVVNSTSTATITIAGTPGEKSSGQPVLVESIQSNFKPSCYGSNRVSFSFSLDRDGAVFFNRCLEGGNLPVGIIYCLSYPTWRKSYSYSAVIDWQGVMDYMDKSFSVGLIFLSVNISDAYTKLAESKSIVIRETVYGEEDSQSRKAFEEQLTIFIKHTFFNPVPFMGDNANLELGFSYKKVGIHDVQMSYKSYFQEASGVAEGMIYPQAFLGEILPKDVSGLITKIDLDDSFFSERTLTVTTNADFKTDLIRCIRVSLTYGTSQPIRFDMVKDDKPQKFSWVMVKDSGGLFVKDINYSFDVIFNKHENIPGWPGKVSSGNKTVQSDFLVVDPRQLYSVKQIRFMAASGAIWKKYKAVVVHASWKDTAGGLLDLTAALDSEKSEYLWKSLRLNGKSPDYVFRLYYRLPDGSIKASPEVISSDDMILIEVAYN
ncbi:MAG TPA: hypothetical protein VHP38_14735 [Ruminiclostridium sp.]|nr:hypothetical protein [Ruminiclostridium sp.]